MAFGDRLYVYRNLWNFDSLYKHYGIDCGDGTVIHYRKPSEIIEQTSIETFSKGNRVYIEPSLEGFCFVPSVVIDRAKSRLGENRYNLLFNNCEHFVNWCKTGISDSKQVRNFVPAIDNFDLSKLNDSIFSALKDTDNRNAQNLIDEALTDLKSVWEQVQPQYKQTLTEIDIWERVAKTALQKDREDLARAAIAKKLNYQYQANKLAAQLQEVATMTENLLRDRLEFSNNFERGIYYNP
jgi:hypothetical protein